MPSTGSVTVTQSDFGRHRARASPIHARMRAALAVLDAGTFTEGHELDRKTEKQVPKAMIGHGYHRTKRRGCWVSSNEGSARPCGLGLDMKQPPVKQTGGAIHPLKRNQLQIVVHIFPMH
jgi:hypothetical protein